MPIYVTPTVRPEDSIFEIFKPKTTIPDPSSFEGRTFKAPLYANKPTAISAPLSPKIPRYAAKPASMTAAKERDYALYPGESRPLYATKPAAMSAPLSPKIPRYAAKPAFMTAAKYEPEPEPEPEKSIIGKVWDWYTSSILPVGTKVPMPGRFQGDIMPVTPPEIGEVTPENKQAYDLIASPATIASVISPLAGASRIPQVLGYAAGGLQAAHGAEELAQGDTGSGLANIALGAIPFLGKFATSRRLPEPVMKTPEPAMKSPEPVIKLPEPAVKSDKPMHFIGPSAIYNLGPTQKTIPLTKKGLATKYPASGVHMFGPGLTYRYPPQEIPLYGKGLAGKSKSATKSASKKVDSPANIPLAMPRTPTKYVSVGSAKNIPPSDVPPPSSDVPFEEAFLRWLRTKRVADIEGGLVRDKLPEITLSELVDRSKSANPIMQHVNKLHRQAQNVLGPDYMKSYIYTFFNEDPSVVKEAFAHRPRGGYTPYRFITDIERGINMGFTPKFTKGHEIAGWLEQRIQKAIANREFYNYLKTNELIRPTPKAPRDWVPLDPRYFPIIGDETKGLTWSAPPEIARAINEAITPDTSILGKVGRFTRYLGRTVLTGGVPWTGINYHGIVNEPARAAMAYGIRHPVEATKGVFTQLGYSIYPKWAAKYLNNNMNDLKDFVKHGMTAGVEDFWSRYPKTEAPPATFLAKVGQLAVKGLDKLDNAFSEATFTRVIPATKLRYAKWQTEQLMKQGLSRDEAMTVASHAANRFFGGLEDALQSREFKQIKDIILLAPDWFATKYQLGKETLKAIKNPRSPEGQIYLNAAATALATYLLTTRARKLITGQEPPTTSRIGGIPVRALDVPGKEAEFDPIGAAYDHVRLPIRTLADLSNKKVPIETVARFARNNASTLVQTSLDFIIGTNPRGELLHPTDRFGRSNPDFYKNVISELFSAVAQQPFQSALDYHLGRITGLEATSQSLELPIRWYRRQLPKVSQQELPMAPRSRF